jgi:hypothetical protein
VIGSRGLRRVVPSAAVVLLVGCAAPGTTPAPAGVRSPVPSSSRPGSPPAPRCPAQGVRLEPDRGDAAAGLRVLGVRLVNCGARTYRLNGYPAVRALDEHRAPLDIRILEGVTEILGPGGPWGAPPGPVVLRPGQRARAVVAWRNTYDDIRKPPVDATFLRIEPLAGRPAQTIEPEAGLDLGSTGRLGVGPWQPLPDDAAAPATRATPSAPASSAPDPVETADPLL